MEVPKTPAPTIRTVGSSKSDMLSAGGEGVVFSVIRRRSSSLSIALGLYKDVQY